MQSCEEKEIPQKHNVCFPINEGSVERPGGTTDQVQEISGSEPTI